MKSLSALYRAGVLVAVAAVSFVGVQAQVDLEDGLEVYLTFDEGEGNVANDSSGNDREMVPADNLFPGAVIDWSGGNFGGSVKFDQNYMIHSPFEYYGIGGSEPRTVSFWMKTEWDAANSSSVGALVGWGVNATQQRIHVKMNGSTDAEGKVLQHIRTENQGGNNYGDTYPLNDGVWHHIVSVFDPAVDANGDGLFETIGDFDHYVDGELETKTGGLTNPVDTNVNPDEGAVPLTVGGGYFPNIDAARTSKARIDEIRIYSRALSLDEILALAAGQGVDGPPAVELANDIEGAELYDASRGIEFTVRAQGEATVAASGVALTLNGSDVSSGLEITGGDQELAGTYGSLRANVVYTGRISATDSLGRTYGFEFSFDTISEDNLTVEAEDFNFDGGQFIDDPVPCNTLGGQPDCYFDKISVIGVDAQDDEFDNRPEDTDQEYQQVLDNIWRYGPGAWRDEQVDTWTSGDTPRRKFVDAEVSDHDVELIQAGEYMNYTRTFPEGRYQVILRARCRVEQAINAGRVNDPTSSNQQLTPLGSFKVPVTGGAYRFVYLTDNDGRNVTLELAGVQTLRLTAVDAAEDLELNYMMFVPVSDEPEPPTNLRIVLNGSQIAVSWQGSGVLQSAQDIAGAWTDIPTEGNTHTEAAESAAKYFRVAAQ